MEEMLEEDPLEASEGAKERVNEAAGVKRARPLRPGQCRSHMRKTLAKEFEEIVDGFVEAAKTGSCSHVKLVTELLKDAPKSSRRKKGSIAQLLEQMDGERADKARLEKL